MKIFPLYYFPPIPWFSASIREEEIYLDLAQPYRKQRYFSRMYVKGAQGVLTLTVPVQRRSKRSPLIEKRISFEENWMQQHWRSIVYAYRNSPYFEFYEDELFPFYTQKEVSLTQYLLSGIQTCFALLGGGPSLQAIRFESPIPDQVLDFRKEFSPDLDQLPPWFRVNKYEQVFGTFIPGLSILDLLFNLGPESRQFLINSVKEVPGDQR